MSPTAKPILNQLEFGIGCEFVWNYLCSNREIDEENTDKKNEEDDEEKIDPGEDSGLVVPDEGHRHVNLSQHHGEHLGDGGGEAGKAVVLQFLVLHKLETSKEHEKPDGEPEQQDKKYGEQFASRD